MQEGGILNFHKKVTGKHMAIVSINMAGSLSPIFQTKIP